jgi:chromate transporter
VLIALRPIYDVPTAALGLATFAVLWRFKLPEPIVVVAAGIIGLIVWPLVQGGR